MATVGLLGIPAARLNKEQTFGIEGATGKPRKDLETLLLEANPQLQVVDFGELFMSSQIFSKHHYGVLSSQVKELLASKRTDLVLAIGGSHVAALPLYHLPGRVVRADAHGDAYVLKGPFSRREITGATYMAFVKEWDLKKQCEVWNVGVRMRELRGEYVAKDGIFGMPTNMPQMLRQSIPDVALIDIDVDVLSPSYGLPHGYTTSDLRAEDLAALVAKLQPKVVGLFECVNRDGIIPENIVSAHPNVFAPICKAVAEAADARAAAAKNGANPRTLPASSATYR